MRTRIFFCVTLLIVAVGAKADTVTVGISTTGCFASANCLYPGGEAGTLTFTGINDQPNSALTTPPDQALTLGSFTFGDNSQAGTIDTTFTATAAFNAPNGAANQTFVATLKGKVVKNNNGTLFIDFDNTPMLITFTDGSFLFSVNDVKLDVANPDRGEEFVTKNWTGAISNIDYNPVPEPASLTLMGTGIFGLAGFLRRRFRA